MRPSLKIALPKPVPSVITTSRPLPSITPRPATSASFSSRAGLPNSFDISSCKAKPRHAFVPRFGAVMTVPRRTTPGKPIEIRSNGGNGLTKPASVSSTADGVDGEGVGARTRFTTIRPVRIEHGGLEAGAADIDGQGVWTGAGVAHRSITSTPRAPATMTREARPMNSPVSMTPDEAGKFRLEPGSDRRSRRSRSRRYGCRRRSRTGARCRRAGSGGGLPAPAGRASSASR